MRDLIGDATPELGHLPEYEVSRGPSVEAQIFGDPRALPVCDILAPSLVVAMADQSSGHCGRFLSDRTLTILSLAPGREPP